jgi:hypothetical protein
LIVGNEKDFCSEDCPACSEEAAKRLQARHAAAHRDLALLANIRTDPRLPELIVELDERYDYYEHRARIWGGHKLGDVTYAARREMVALVRALLSPGDAGRGEGGGT